MNGRLNKVQMLAKVMRMKDGLHQHSGILIGMRMKEQQHR